MRSFWVLSTERVSAGGTIGRIPWSRAIRYARHVGVSAPMLECFWIVITAMDDGFCKLKTNEHAAATRRGKREAKAEGKSLRAGKPVPVRSSPP